MPTRFRRPPPPAGPRAKPPLRPQTTTLWDYPSQHYGDTQQGDQRYVGATPSYILWNLLTRYTAEGDLVVDPFCGSGTTLDVAKDTRRNARGFDLAPYRSDIEKADARRLPLEKNSAALVFMDPPYGDHIHYSDDPACIGKLSAYDEAYFRAMDRAFAEGARVLKQGGIFAVYVCDVFDKKRGFLPVGFRLYDLLMRYTLPVDIVCVTRHNKALLQGNFHQAAERDGFYLRGFNYLFITQKP